MDADVDMQQQLCNPAKGANASMLQMDSDMDGCRWAATQLMQLT